MTLTKTVNLVFGEIIRIIPPVFTLFLISTFKVTDSARYLRLVI